jgi:hypothetical protein
LELIEKHRDCLMSFVQECDTDKKYEQILVLHRLQKQFSKIFRTGMTAIL